MPDPRPLAVRGDERGNLVAIESLADLPFAIERVYYLFGTKTGVVRGLHAHRRLRQAAVAISGGCTIDFDDGSSTASVRLDSPSALIVIDPMVWHEIRDFTADCVLLVLADAHYQEDDYIRNRGEFLQLCRQNG